jgi:hypothetical protein
MNRLNDEQRQHWEDQGYLHLKNIVPREEISTCLSAVDQLLEQHEHDNPADREKGAYVISQALFRTAALDHLMDHSNLIGILLDLMGPYLQILGSEVYVRYPGGKMPRWHLDAGRSIGQVRVTPDSLPINFKIQFFLTDIPAENHANFSLVPGSHRHPMPKKEGRLGTNWGIGGTDPPGAIQMIAEAGDCAVFPNTLWHAVSANESADVRRSFTLRYGQMWCHPYDYEKCPGEVLERMTPRQRRMMGELQEGYDVTEYYKPQDQIEVMMEGLDFECPNA